MADDSPDDTELERLLTQLLRVVSPAIMAGTAETEGPDGGAPPGPPAAAQPGIVAGWPAVSASEARALAELVTARGLAQGELAGLLGLEKSTVSRLAAGLERKGWIRRGRDEDNQRYVRLYLTPEGRARALPSSRPYPSSTLDEAGEPRPRRRAAPRPPGGCSGLVGVAARPRPPVVRCVVPE